MAYGTVPDEVRPPPLKTRASTPTVVGMWAGWPLGAEAPGALQDPKAVVSALVPQPRRRPQAPRVSRACVPPTALQPGHELKPRASTWLAERGAPDSRPRTA